MQTYRNPDIQELPLSAPYFRRKAESFLEANGLRLESLDVYYTIQDADGEILAGAGLQADVIKGLAVAAEARSEGLALPLLSHVVSAAAARGVTNLKVFTKPEHRALFESLGFRLLASAPEAVLLENGRGLEQYCRYLAGLRKPGRTGVVVMNANPFTQGHRYLLEQAAARTDHLVVIPVREDVSLFSYAERVQMLRAGAPPSVVVAEGSGYQISALTFPTYFLKDLSTAAETQMRLDLDLFARHIAPALGAVERFAGSEPLDALTGRYNRLMQELLPARGIAFTELPRLEDAAGPVSASRVRSALAAGRCPEAEALTPATTHPFLLACLACEALQKELDTPGKPGLVGPDACGAHRDMDYGMMQRSVGVLRPFFVRMAQAQDTAELRRTGIEAEAAMLASSGGVNTHRGAIFALGLAVFAHSRRAAKPLQETLTAAAAELCAEAPRRPDTHGAQAVASYGVRGAREMALGGYRELFGRWLPFYRSVKAEPQGCLRTLLLIMSELDDTCILHRAGPARAQAVKREAGELALHFGEEALSRLCAAYAAEGISPGGAADMLALTIFIDTITSLNNS